jgi:iron complex outermembrane receptor protein
MSKYKMGASIIAIAAALGGSVASAAETNVSEVIVTGTRQTGVKAADSAAPIQIVGSTALTKVGQPDLISALEQNLPSFSAEAEGGDTAAFTLAASLRGLNPNDTLVLVNGKRRNTTANLHVDPSVFQGAFAPDLSLIPVASIDHIEVLQDGASAQYGTDAIAGVVNIILKTSDHGGMLTGMGGSYYQGDGLTGQWAANLGLPIGDKGFLNFTAEERYHGYALQGGIDRRVLNEDGTIKSSNNAINLAGLPGADNFPYVNKINGDGESNTYTAFYNAGYEIADGVQLYSYGDFSHRNASAYENYRVPSKVTCSTCATPVPFPNGFDPREAINENEGAITGGVRGMFSGWNWDLSTTWGVDKDKIYTLHSANASLYADTGFTPTDFYDGGFTSWEWTSNLDISHDFDVGLATPLNVAIGGEYRKDSYSIAHGDPGSIYKEGGQSFPGWQLTDAGTHERTNEAVYIDFANNPIKPLHIDLAGRFEHYSDFGNTEVGKATARYDFSPAFALRGTISTGFRAPTLAEESYSATNVAPTFAVVQLPADSSAAQLAGFQSLKPEKSWNYSVGFVAHPLPSLQITADLYEILIHDRIIATGTLLGLSGTTVVSPGVLAAIHAHGNVLDPGVSYVGISVFTNGANTRTRGAEVTLNYASDFGEVGRATWSLGFNYNETKVTKQFPLPPAVYSAPFGQTALLGPSALSALTTGTPRWKLIPSVLFTHGKWTIFLKEDVYGETKEVVSLNGTGVNGLWETIPVTPITDLDISYQITGGLKLAVGANNLFNHKPPLVPNVPDGSGGVRPADGSNVYDVPMGFSPFGINGGFYYGRVTLTF